MSLEPCGRCYAGFHDCDNPTCFCSFCNDHRELDRIREEDP